MTRDMTRDEILGLDWGAVLDSLVALKVWRWQEKVIETNTGNKLLIWADSDGKNTIYRKEDFMPSRSISQAWDIVEELGKEYWVEIHNTSKKRWCCILHDFETAMRSVHIMADSAAEAICKAAVLVAMEKDDEQDD